MDSNIKNIVEIVLEVSKQVQAKYEQKEEQLTEDLEEAKKAYSELDKQVFELEEQVKELEGQRDRQAAKIIGLTDARDSQAKTVKELTDVRDRQKKRIDDLEKEVKARQEMQPATDEKLQKKLDKAMDHIRRQGEEIDKLRAGAADPRWVPLRSRRPDMNENVLACTKRGTIYIAQETGEGWKNTTGKMAEPVAWMPLPAKYTGGEE